jgi:hypothetical protein
MDEPKKDASQEEWERFYKKQGWDILRPKLIVDRANCRHEWVKIKEGDWQCKKCRQGYLGEKPK